VRNAQTTLLDTALHDTALHDTVLHDTAPHDTTHILYVGDRVAYVPPDGTYLQSELKDEELEAGHWGNEDKG